MRHRGRILGAVVYLCLFSVFVVCPAAAFASPASLGGISYSPSGVETFADLESGISEAHIRSDLKQLATLTGEIRTYTMDHGLNRVPAIAATLGLKVTLGLWLGHDHAANDVEIARAIAAIRANPGTITRVIVGNEAIQHDYMKRDDLIAAMAVVRRGVAGTHIPVGTAEIWSVWFDNRELAAASDFIGAHILPYWDGVTNGEAVAYVSRRANDLAKAFPGKPVVISETGWPSSGPVHEGAVASPANQTHYAVEFATMARKRGYAYFLVEAYDEPWKALREGDTPQWGIFTVRGTPKPVAAQFHRP